ncbi:SRPBCC family protein [Andreprevotia chitinilytica]|uniref:SRPBCC family protein n=1 Tax=Andreprevotia chitinilytica TaxID=396808 RepID=UPI00054CDFB9|nr:SRPBCC family protein [Andreprevotia chitinilytica]
MYRHQVETTVAVASAQLFAAKSRIADWPQWDAELEAIGIDVPLQAGAAFWLKPRGGPKVAMRIEALVAPHTFVDIARLPLAQFRTRSEFLPADSGTLVRETFEVFGPLAWLWNRLLVRKMAAGAVEEIHQFAAFVARQS